MKLYSRKVDRIVIDMVLFMLMRSRIDFAVDYKDEFVEVSVKIEYRKNLNIIISDSQKNLRRAKVV
jgi:hypothetical protein